MIPLCLPKDMTLVLRPYSKLKDRWKGCKEAWERKGSISK